MFSQVSYYVSGRGMWMVPFSWAALFIVKEEANFSLFQCTQPHAQQLLEVKPFVLFADSHRFLKEHKLVHQTDTSSQDTLDGRELRSFTAPEPWAVSEGDTMVLKSCCTGNCEENPGLRFELNVMQEFLDL